MKLKLVDDWRNWWKWGSVQVAAAASAAITWVATSPESTIPAILALPKPLRIAAIAGFLVLWVLARILKREKADDAAGA